MGKFAASIFLGFSLICACSFGGRTAFVPPLNLVGSIDYSKNAYGDPIPDADIAGAPYNSQCGFQIAVEIDLVNLSSTAAQTGKFEIIPGTGYAAWGACSFGSADYHFRSTVILCGSISGKHVAVNPVGSAATSAAYMTTNVPSPVDWTLPAGGFTRVSALMWLDGQRANPPSNASPTNGCYAGLNFRFSPKLKISVNEDRGAISASFIYRTAGLSTAGSSTACSGFSVSGASWDGFRPAYPPSPIPINGGRPF